MEFNHKIAIEIFNTVMDSKNSNMESDIEIIKGILDKNYSIGVVSQQGSKTPYDDKGNSKHYSDQRINVIHMLETIWGTEATMTFCEMNAFKYRMRIGKKDDPKLELTKISWYEKMALFLFNKGQKVSGLGTGTIPLPEKFQQLLNK